MTNERLMKQYAPFPEALSSIVLQLCYRPGWEFFLEDTERDPVSSHGAAAGGLTFRVKTLGYNSYRPERGQSYAVNHYFIVPAATYGYAAWLRWVFDCLLKVEAHECMEFFALRQPCVDSGSDRSRGCAGWDGTSEHHENCPLRGKDTKPYAPNHGPGEDPYTIHDPTTDVARRTRFTGEVLDAPG